MKSSFKVWIDADSCPKEVRNYVTDYSTSKNISLIFVANRDIFLGDNSDKENCNEQDFSVVICKKEKDSADNYILEHAEADDLVITRDIPFAEKLIEKNIQTINDRGTVFTKENIKEKLAERNFNLNLAALGFSDGKSKRTYGKKELEKFIRTFERITAQLLMNEAFSKRK